MKRTLLLTAYVLFVFNLGCPATSDPIARLEPPNWWVGMKNPELQVLVYGENVAELAPRIDYPGVVLHRTIRTENPNYLFLYLQLADDVAPGNLEIDFLDGQGTDAELVTSRWLALSERKPGSANRRGFDSSDVMYLITPDRFANGNPENDEVVGMPDALDRSDGRARHGGDLQGIAMSLDYIEEMGFTAVWVNPVLENNMPTFSYHGYAATDFYRVDPRLGSNEEYRRLIQEMDSRGIRMIMDMILNHCGSEHWFVQDPPTGDWINFGGEYVNTNHKRTTNQDYHAAGIDRRQHADGWFVESMPDLNQRNPLMADYLIQNTIWWIEYAGLAGIRMDTYPYPDKDFMTDWTCAVMTEYPHFNVVGEEWSYQPAIVSYWQRGKANHDGYQSCLPSLMDFPLKGAVWDALRAEEETFDQGFIRIYETLALDFLYPDAANLVVFPDNHDTPRFFTKVDEDYDLFKLGMVYFATTRGVPQFFYGTEILMDSSANPSDHGLIRSDFPGGWPNDTVSAYTGEGLREEQLQAQAFVKRLLNWRQGSEAVHFGKLTHFAPENAVYVYFRYTANDSVMVVLSKNDEPVELELARFAECMEGFEVGVEVLTGERLDLRGGILRVPARAALVLDRDQ